MARLFNGTNATGQLPIDLSIYSTISVAFWLYWDAFANNDKLALEYGTTTVQAGAFTINPNAGSGTAAFDISLGKASAGVWRDSVTRPSAAVWHHWLIVMDRSVPLNLCWLDGVAVTFAATLHQAGTYGNFGNLTFNLMCRNGGSLFGAGRMADFAVWGGVRLGNGEASELSKNVSPGNVRPDRLVAYLPLEGAVSANREPAYGRMRALIPNLPTLTNTTGVAHRFGQRTLIRPRKKTMVMA